MDEVERSGVAAAIAKTETYSLEAARPRIAMIVEKNVTRDDLRQPALTYGYSLVADAGPAGEPRHMQLWIKAGGRVSGSTWLRAGDYKVLPDPALVTYPLFKAALLAINAIWPGTYAYAYANRTDYEKPPLFEPLPFFDFHIPWLGYLSAPLAAGLAPPPEILTERTPDGGLLMSATEERLDPTVPEHWPRARLIAETMVARMGKSISKPG
jgi:hypothetical protein